MAVGWSWYPLSDPCRNNSGNASRALVLFHQSMVRANDIKQTEIVSRKNPNHQELAC